MKNILVIVSCLVLFGNSCFSQTIINGGTVFGLWEKSKSPYQILGEIVVPHNQTLTIESGVKIEFQGHHKFIVNGRLLAIGNKTDSIIFTGKDNIKWAGIRFQDIAVENDTSKLGYCVVKNSHASSGLLPRAATTDDYGGGIYIRSSKLTISNSCIRNNKAYIAGGIYCEGNNTTIINTVIRNNEAIAECGGLYLSMSNPSVIGCLIRNNKANQMGGMRIEFSNALLINNTICNNSSDDPFHGTIFIRGNPKIFNTIFYYNKPNFIHIDDQGSYPDFQFNDLENGISCIVDYYPSVKGYFDGIYKNNIESPPVFMDMQNGNYRLANSHCINSGGNVPMALIPKLDIDGNPRIYNDTKARIDIGACEYQGTPTNRGPFISKMETQYILRSLKSKLTINYFDPDLGDKLSFIVTTNSPHVAARIVSVNDTTIITEIDPEMNWKGECYVYINIDDNSHSTNSTTTDSIKVVVSNQFKGVIDSEATFQDTVLVIGDVTIKELGSLKIQPGSFVQFQDCYKIKVLGKLNILGTKQNKVILNAKDTISYRDGNLYWERGWRGIEFIGINRTDTMRINYCLIRNIGENKLRNYVNGTISILDSRNIHINNCSFESNYSTSYDKSNSGIYVVNSHNIQINDCKFSTGYSSEKYATYVTSFGSDLLIDKCSFYNTICIWGFNWHCIYLQESAVQIRNSSFINNHGNSLIHSSYGSLIIENCIIKDNKSDGIYNATRGALIRNNVFINNRVAINCRVSTNIIGNLIGYSKYICGCSNFNGSAINIFDAGAPLIANNTIVNNQQDSKGNAVYASYSSPIVVNNIFWNNYKEGVGYYNGFEEGVPDPIIKNNIIKGIRDNFNFDLNPMFRLKDSLDYSLLPTSPAINIGLADTTGLHLPPVDLLGKKRIDLIHKRLDLGAYEYSNDVFPDGVNIQSLREIDIYPNPTNSMLNIPDEYNRLSYVIYNLNGQSVQSGSITNHSIKVNLLPENTYLLRIKDGNKYIIAKFIKI